MPALVPSLGDLFQSLVVAVLVFFDDPLQADVSADLKADMVALKEQRQPRDAAVAVPKRVNAKKIEVHARHGNDRVNLTLAEPVMLNLGNFPQAIACRVLAGVPSRLIYSALGHEARCNRWNHDNRTVVFSREKDVPGLIARYSSSHRPIFSQTVVIQ